MHERRRKKEDKQQGTTLVSCSPFFAKERYLVVGKGRLLYIDYFWEGCWVLQCPFLFASLSECVFLTRLVTALLGRSFTLFVACPFFHTGFRSFFFFLWFFRVCFCCSKGGVQKRFFLSVWMWKFEGFSFLFVCFTRTHAKREKMPMVRITKKKTRKMNKIIRKSKKKEWGFRRFSEKEEKWESVCVKVERSVANFFSFSVRLFSVCDSFFSSSFLRVEKSEGETKETKREKKGQPSETPSEQKKIQRNSFF